MIGAIDAKTRETLLREQPMFAESVVEFDPILHRYSRNGVTLPGVTGVLEAVGISDASKYTPGSDERGKAVHLATQYLDESDLDETSLAPELSGYLRAYRRFLSDTGWKWIAIEKRLGHLTLGYAGTIDRISEDAIVDIKSGGPEKWHALQLAAYLAMLADPMSRRRYGLYLARNGAYALKEYPRQEFSRDWAVFQSALNIYNWRGNGNSTGGSTGRD